MAELDADAELAGMPLTGVSIEVVRRASLEFRTAAELCAEVDSNGGHSHTDGEPANNLEGFRALLPVKKNFVHWSVRPLRDPAAARRTKVFWFFFSKKNSLHSGFNTRHKFCPPNPNELEIARRITASRATFGTQSSGSAGSGVR